MVFTQSNEKKVPILMYHSISEHAAPKFKPFAVSPTLFAEHMAYLHQYAYTPITVTQFIDARSKGSSALPEQPVVLTFDDGFADFFTEALPVLQRYGFPATLYVTTAFVKGTSRWLQREGEATRPMLTWDQITEIGASGIECGGHSHCHPQLDILPLSSARQEIIQSKRLLEQHLGQEISSFAYPYGYHTAAIKRLVREAGYTSACAVKYEMSSESTGAFALGRLMVGPNTSVDALAALLTSGYPSVFTTVYKRARTPVWRIARRCSDQLIRKAETSPSTIQAEDYTPARILEIELGKLLPSVPAVDEKTGQRYQRAMCLVRLHTHPLGVVEFQLTEGLTSPFDYAQHIWCALGTQINEHLQQDNLPLVTGLDVAGLPGSGTPRCIKERERFLARAPFVSVIVPTRDRPERIQLCLRSLLTQHYPQYEVIIVDNAPSTSATADFIRQTYHDEPRVRCVREDHPGASRARNCGAMAARGEILAFTDDDMVVDSYWLVELVRAFGLADGVACVTGLVLPVELETPPQFWIEEFGGFGKGFTRRIFDMVENHPKTALFPYTAGRLGTGASMAFRAAFLHSAGGFDPALGPGSPAQGGEDLTLFFQAVTRDYKLVYEPAALVYHPHHRDYSDLQKQIYGYGVGLAAYLTRSVFDTPRLLLDLVTKLPYGLFFMLSVRSPKNSKKSENYPRELTMLERKGMLYGPFAYVRSRWALHKACKAA